MTLLPVIISEIRNDIYDIEFFVIRISIFQGRMYIENIELNCFHFILTVISNEIKGGKNYSIKKFIMIKYEFSLCRAP